MAASERDTKPQTEAKAQGGQDPAPEPHINTYHCLCNNLVLATARPLLSLPRRAEPSQDKAYILPTPRLPRRLTKRMRAFDAGTEEEEEDDDDDDDEDEDESGSEEEEQPGSEGRPARSHKEASAVENLVIPVSLPRAAGATMVRRSDGFEKRWLLRCGRCRLVVGYQLDWSQFAAAAEPAAVKGNRAARRGRRDDVMYILPGALRSTDDMVEAKKVADAEVGFGTIELAA